MKTLPGLLLLALVGGGPTCGVGPQIPPPQHARFLYLAVLEGLYEEAVDPAVAKSIVEAPGPGHFVVKCPACEPVRFAFEVYAAKPRFRMGRLDEGALPAAIADGLKSPDRAQRLKALETLVDRFVERKLARTVMTESEKGAFRTWAAQARKLGTSVKPPDFGDYCPSCNGVNPKK